MTLKYSTSGNSKWHNPFNRIYEGDAAKYFVIVQTVRGFELVTHAGFASKKDAEKYLTTIASCYSPFIVKRTCQECSSDYDM